MKTPPKRCIKGEAHHWMISSPSGHNQKGTCKKCGKSYDGFKNTFDYSYWRNFKENATKKKKTRKTVSRWDKKHNRSKFQIHP
jgi:hypothetical protein